MDYTYAIWCDCGRYTRRTLSDWLETKNPRCECGKSLEAQRREFFVAVSKTQPRKNE